MAAHQYRKEKQMISSGRFSLGAEFAYDSGAVVHVAVMLRAPDDYDPEQPGETRLPPRELCKRAERGIAQALEDFRRECAERGIKL
jgi:hypothetical protein